MEQGYKKTLMFLREMFIFKITEIRHDITRLEHSEPYTVISWCDKVGKMFK